MPYFESGGIRLHYIESGSGEPLIFLHGFTMDHRQWTEQIDHLSAKYRTIAPDARGHGKSEAPETNYAREDRAGDLLNLMSHLGIEKAHVIGASMGGADAFCFAIDHPERLLSLTPVGTVIAGWKPKRQFIDKELLAEGLPLEQVKERFIEAVLVKYRERDPAMHDRLKEIMSDFSGKPWSDPKKGKYPIREELPLAGSVNIPICLIVGKQDIMFRPLSEELAGLLPNGRLEMISNAGHLVNMDAPQRFNERLEAFLEGLVKK